ncbi:hypothetical protein GCM10007112_16580 [Vulcanisaeta souniana JCM 11219]|uniref:Uncharacterized protein n=1 Tax=Vulcanisaeta souniana JCM 11219 TaxID=1293586 RepID=A0A830E7Z2_9CREN|nr:hypothetical protein GCM10007112_16580 [Vulcanisaeta souniana JCM 11219]
MWLIGYGRDLLFKLIEFFNRLNLSISKVIPIFANRGILNNLFAVNTVTEKQKARSNEGRLGEGIDWGLILRNVDSTGVDRTIGLIILEYGMLGVIDAMVKLIKEYISKLPDDKVDEEYRRLADGIDKVYEEYMNELNTRTDSISLAFKDIDTEAARRVRDMLRKALDDAYNERKRKGAGVKVSD